MRKDFDKLLCECYRYRGYHRVTYRKFRRRAKVDIYDEDSWDDLHEFRGARKVYGWERKEFGENLEPLRRFIESRIGHHWDDVYSEIREVFNVGGSTEAGGVKGHIFAHLWDYIAVKVWEEDGKLWEASYNGRPFRLGEYSWHHRVCYVDPDTKIIKAIPSKRPEWKSWESKKKKEIKISENLEAEKIDGLWFIFEYETVDGVPDVWYDKPVSYSLKQIEGRWVKVDSDVTHRVSRPGIDANGYKNGDRRFIRKKSASAKEIEEYKLEG